MCFIGIFKEIGPLFLDGHTSNVSFFLGEKRKLHKEELNRFDVVLMCFKIGESDM